MEKIPKNVQKEIWADQKKHYVVYFATSVRDQPSVRPVTMVPLESDLWILTGMKDAKTKQLQENPKIEVCLPIKKDENTGYARFSGKAIIIKDLETKKDIAGKVDYFKDYWDTPEDPNFALLKMEFDKVEYLRPGEMYAKEYSL